MSGGDIHVSDAVKDSGDDEDDDAVTSARRLYSTFWSNLSKNFSFWGP